MVLYCELCIVCEEAERAGQAEEKIVVNFNVYQIPGEAEISAGGTPGWPDLQSLGGRNAGMELKIKQVGPFPPLLYSSVLQYNQTNTVKVYVFPIV